MANYDYKAGKKRINEILNNKLEISEPDNIPKENAFTFENGYYCWVTSVFVDIRNSSTLFSNEDKEKVAKIIRCFTSEIIEILREDLNLREIGIRGDCVYAVYSTPSKVDEFEIAQKTFYVNTYITMLNKLLNNKNIEPISVGIGMSTAKELIVKAGRKDVGINNLVWIGDAVARASHLSSLGNKNGLRPIIFSSESYNNFIDILVKNNGQEAKGWFALHNTSPYTKNFYQYYDASIIKTEFNSWIEDGMKD